MWPITPADVRSALQVDSADLTDLAVQRYCDGAMSAAEATVGLCRGQSFATLARHRGGTVILDHAAASVTTVTVNGEAVTDWTFDADAPRFVRNVRPGDVKVVALAPTTAPADEVEGATISLAIHRLLQDRPTLGLGEQQAAMGYATPNRCQQVFDAHREWQL